MMSISFSSECVNQMDSSLWWQLNKLEQLERLRSENTPHRRMITHTIDSYQIPSPKNLERM